MHIKSLVYSSSLVWCGIVFALVFLTYSGTLSNKFAFDDKSLVVENAFLKNTPPLSVIFTSNYRAGSGFTGDGLYRPIVMLSYILNAKQPLSPFPFHFFNVTLNALNSVLFLLLIVLVFRNLPLAVLSSLLFGLHPLHTEAVANIAGRPELIYTACVLGAWVAREKISQQFVLLPIFSILYICGLLSKETAIMFPFMLFGTDLLRNQRILGVRILLQYGILALLTILYLVWRWHILGPTAAGLEPDFVDNPIANAPFLTRISTAFSVFVRYCGLLLAPVVLSADYSYNQIPILHSLVSILPLTGLLSFVGVIVIAVIYRKKTIIPFSIILIIFPYILISNIIFPVGTIMGERLLYLSVAGISLLYASVIVYLHGKHMKTGVIVFSFVVLYFSFTTIDRNRDWFDDKTLFTSDLNHAPRSVKVLCNLGYLIGKEGRTEESLGYFKRALEIHPLYPEALRGYGKRLYDLKRYGESIKYYAKAVEVAPNDVDGRNDYGIVLGKIGRFSEAEEQYNAAMIINPNNPVAFQEMSGILIDRGQYDKALDYLRKAAERGGDRRIILNNSAVALFLSNNINDAFSVLRTAESEGIMLNSELSQAIRAAYRQ